jgi:hypothetical protein
MDPESLTTGGRTVDLRQQNRNVMICSDSCSNAGVGNRRGIIFGPPKCLVNK